MKVSIEVKDRREGELIKVGLSHGDVRAFVVICGALSGLSSDRARARVLNYCVDASRDPNWRHDPTQLLDPMPKGNGAEVAEHDEPREPATT